MSRRKPLKVGEYVTVHVGSFELGGREIGVCRVVSLKSGALNAYIKVEQVEATEHPVGTTWHHHEGELKRTKPPKNPINVIFRQENPHDQLVSITQAIEGNLMNIEHRISKSARENLKLQIKCLKVLRKHIKNTHWTNESMKVT